MPTFRRVRDDRAGEREAELQATAAELAADGQSADARVDQLEADLEETQVQRDDLKRRLDAAERANTPSGGEIGHARSA